MPLPAHQRCHDPERRGRSVLAQAPKTSMAASAAPHVSEDGDAGCERTATRTNQRNGTRERLLSTKAENATGPRYRGPDQLFCERTTGFEPATLTLAR